MRTMINGAHRRFEHFIELIISPCHTLGSLGQTLRNTRFVLHTAGKARRFFMVHIRKQYVQQQLAIRQGSCNQCGMCCNLLFTCPMLTQQGRCLAYTTCRPKACKVFPINQKDIDEIKQCGGQCGYRFME